MANGLEFIHSKKLVHRDIKPDNVLISASGPTNVQMKLSDFGFCKVTDSEGKYSMKSGVVGTMDWLAPETVHFTRRPSNNSDVFSLGCVFFYLLRKVHPFGEEYNIRHNIDKDKPVNWDGMLLLH